MTKQVFKCIGNGHGTSREIHLEQVKGMQTVSTSRHRHCRHSDALAPFACFRWQAELIVRKGNSIEIDFSTVPETERDREGKRAGRYKWIGAEILCCRDKHLRRSQGHCQKVLAISNGAASANYLSSARRGLRQSLIESETATECRVSEREREKRKECKQRPAWSFQLSLCLSYS